MNRTDLPALLQPQALSVNGTQAGLVSRGLDMLGVLTQPRDDDSAELQWKLGCEYLKGSEAERDYEWAFYWFGNAARLGHAEAQFALASLYEAGNGIKQDDEQAIAWYQQAAAQGHAWARHNLAMRGISVDPAE